MQQDHRYEGQPLRHSAQVAQHTPVNQWHSEGKFFRRTKEKFLPRTFIRMNRQKSKQGMIVFAASAVSAPPKPRTVSSVQGFPPGITFATHCLTGPTVLGSHAELANPRTFVVVFSIPPDVLENSRQGHGRSREDHCRSCQGEI